MTITNGSNLDIIELAANEVNAFNMNDQLGEVNNTSFGGFTAPNLIKFLEGHISINIIDLVAQFMKLPVNWENHWVKEGFDIASQRQPDSAIPDLMYDKYVKHVFRNSVDKDIQDYWDQWGEKAGNVPIFVRAQIFSSSQGEETNWVCYAQVESFGGGALLVIVNGEIVYESGPNRYV